MITVPGYDGLTTLYEGPDSVVCRAVRIKDGRPVVLKALKKEFPTLEEITRYKREYEITHALNRSDVQGVIEAYGLEEQGSTHLIVFEDFGGESLDKWIASRRFTLKESLALAIKITEALGAVHAANVIHKDINPSNILFNPETSQIRIIGFDTATRLSRENPVLKNPQIIEGTLAYISPEQTGRMNRSIDYRTDYYSLGASLYEFFTGKVPFDSPDPIELIHCHMARWPLPPHAHHSEIPSAVSRIVLKLLSKNAEERYQSAVGIAADLQECLRQLELAGRISDFPLAVQDRIDRFQIPEKLYGREREIETLLSAFGRVAEGRSELMLVSGQAGIGKTALVREIYKPLTERRAYFISGKFDQYHRNIPYHALIQAFQALVRQLLSESEERLSKWRAAMLTALGPNGRVIIEVIPDVEMIVGPQPPVPELSPSEAQNRFHILLMRFIEALHGPEHPLVIFLDDLQWADSASLKLIQRVMTASEGGHLFVIGAYRSDEVERTHPLLLTLNEIEKTSAIVNRIDLTSLALPDVNEFVADTFIYAREEAKPLAELLLAKTDGNPFFMGEFLRALHTRGLIRFDADRGSWRWDLEQITKAEMTNNVVELMVGKIMGLAETTREVLRLAACIGSPFDLHTLAIVYDRPAREAASSLWAAIEGGLVYPLGDAYKYVDGDTQDRVPEAKVEYMFCHDRIQQAAYSLIPEAGRQAVHWQVGQLLLRKTSPEERDQKLFDILNQLNKGIGIITAQPARDEVAHLNLLAGRKATASAAYQSALDYFRRGIDLLADNSWETHYDLTLSLYAAAAEAAYVCTYYDEMDSLAAVVLNKARTLLDKMKVQETRLLAYTGQNRPQETVKKAMEVLKLLGIRLPRATKVSILLSLLKTKKALTGKTYDDLLHLPRMTDPYKLAATRILAIASTAAFHSDPRILALIEIELVNLTLRYGNAPESAFAYSMYGFFLCGPLGKIEAGYKYGKLAMGLLELSQNKEFACRTVLVFNVGVRHWKEHARDTLDALQKNYQVGLETGDIEFAAISGVVYCLHSFYVGRELKRLEEEMSYYCGAIARLSQEPILNIQKARLQMVSNLLQESEDPRQLIGQWYDEIAMLPQNLAANDVSTLYAVYLSKLMLCFLFGDYTGAVEHAANAEKYLTGVHGLIDVTLLNFYGSLARLSLYPGADQSLRKRLRKRVGADQKKMKTWADLAPMNHLHKYCLVEAERLRVLGQTGAEDLYDRAIALAQENGFVQEEAMGCELAGRYWQERKKEHIARLYMKRAHFKYRQWGASRKVQDLDERYSDLLAQQHRQDDDMARSYATTYGTHAESGSRLLDLGAMMKASQAISSEIALDNLLKRIMILVMENAGAEKGFLLLKEGDQLFIEAQTDSEAIAETKIESVPIALCDRLSPAIVHYVVRTKENLVLNDAAREGAFTWDDYVRREKSRSILCIPIVHQGEVIGVLYLENNLAAGAFTPERVEVLQLLASQAAISIENSRFYRMLEESEGRYRSLFENAIEGIFQIAPDSRLIEVNPAMARIMGYDSPEEILSLITDIRKQCFVSADDGARLFRLINKEDHAIGFETQLYRKNGQVIWVSISSRVVRDGHRQYPTLRRHAGRHHGTQGKGKGGTGTGSGRCRQ